MGDSVKNLTEVQDKWLNCILEDINLTSGSLRGGDSSVTFMERSCAGTLIFTTVESDRSAGQCQLRSSCEVAACAQIVHSRKILLSTA